MPSQPGLFQPPASYERFGQLPEDYPFNQFTPLHPAFIGRSLVTTGTRFKRRYFVDLALNECTCDRGACWAYGAPPSKPHVPKWYIQKSCTHKLRMMASIITGTEDLVPKADMVEAYYKALSKRYNAFEVVSAFHKELRRGDFDAAWFWALILAQHRGRHGIIKYLSNIMYEETRDHDLCKHVAQLWKEKRTQVTLPDMAHAIRWFCRSIKKWELPHRLGIFQTEMAGYDSLAKEFGWDVAKGGDIISAKQDVLFFNDIEHGFKDKDWYRFQRGLKGLQKLKHGGDIEAHRWRLYEWLYDFADKHLPDTHDVWSVIAAVNERVNCGLGAGYHELNAIADAIAGEPYSAGLLSAHKRRAIRSAPTPEPPLAFWPEIPLYAQDNHTYGGKALMRRFPEQLKPGAEQTDLDFRYCGAYFGVCWRYLAYDQHRDIAVAWDDVKWPKPLARVTQAMWY